MVTSDQGRALIKCFERLELIAYWDGGKPGNGTLTIGWGHTGKDVVPGLQIDLATAESLFAADVREVDEAMADLIEDELAQYEYDALASFIFNIGWPKFSRSTLLQRIDVGDKKAAAEEILRWHYQGKVDVEGLKSRRAREADIFLHGF